MTVRRHTFQIFVEIMENCRESIAGTRLMRHVGVHSTFFKKYVCFLEELGFIERVKPARFGVNPDGRGKPAKFLYKISSKGVEALRWVKEAYLLSELFSYGKWLDEREGEL